MVNNPKDNLVYTHQDEEFAANDLIEVNEMY